MIIFRYIGTIMAMILVLPFVLLMTPFIVIIKTVVTIWQPYFFKRDSQRFDEYYQECLRKGIYIDFPPKYGTFLGIGPWGKQDG